MLQDSTFQVSSRLQQRGSVGFIDSGDPDNATLSYEILSGNLDFAFSIREDGEIVVNNAAPINIDTNPVFTLEISATDGEFISNATYTIELVEVTAIGEGINASVIYPNPVSNILFIGTNDFQANSYTVEVVDLSGKKVIENVTNNQVDVSSLKSGTYVLKVSIHDEIQLFKFIKE